MSVEPEHMEYFRKVSNLTQALADQIDIIKFRPCNGLAFPISVNSPSMHPEVSRIVSISDTTLTRIKGLLKMYELIYSMLTSHNPFLLPTKGVSKKK